MDWSELLMGSLSSLRIVALAIECHAGHVVEVTLLLRESPNQNTDKYGAEQA